MIKLFLLLNLFAKVFIICSDTTEVERYEEALFDFGSDAESLNLFEHETHCDSEDESFTGLPYFIDRVRTTFNFENQSRQILEQDHLMRLEDHRNNHENLFFRRVLMPTRNNYRNLAHRHSENGTLNYRSYTEYNSFTRFPDRFNGPCYKALFVMLVVTFLLAVVTHR